MRLRVFIFVVVGLALSAGLFSRAQALPDRSSAPHSPAALGLAPSEFLQVFVAARPIQFGESVDPEAVKVQPWPKALLPEAVVTDPAQMFPEGEGWRRARAAFVAGEVILRDKLSPRGEKVTGIALSDPTNQAKALNVSSAAVAGGMVMPGDLVDVLLVEERSGDLRAVTVAQLLRVLAVEGDVSPLRTTIDRTLVVEVTQSQGQRLALAQQAGTLSVAVRTDADSTDRIPDPLMLSEVRPGVSGASGASGSGAGRARSDSGVIVRRGGIATIERVIGE